MLAPVAWLASLWLLRHRPGRLLGTLSLPLAYAATTWIWKPLWARQRPPTAMAESFAYPSGHTTLAFALAAGLVLVHRRGWIIAVTMGVGTGVLRMMAGEHWLTDVLGALLWTAAYVLAVDGLTADDAASRSPRPNPP